ncbi:MAG: 16S rRNA (guanine(527)-N(7))-methyltransferase RsmG [Bacteriovoracia bacterium]
MITKKDWDELSSFLKERGDKSGVCEDASFRAACEHYLKILLQKNEVLNLTAVRDLEVAFWKHLADSLVLLGWEPLGKVVDWGSGGGLPGVPLALSRVSRGQEGQVLFLDSVGKKLRAIEEFVAELKIPGCGFSTSRGEVAIKSGEFHGVNTVVMRAVAPAERAAAWMDSSIGRWVFLLTPAQIADWEKEAPRLKRKGLHLARSVVYDLPRGHGSRALLEYSK